MSQIITNAPIVLNAIDCRETRAGVGILLIGRADRKNSSPKTRVRAWTARTDTPAPIPEASYVTRGGWLPIARAMRLGQSGTGPSASSITLVGLVSPIAMGSLFWIRGGAGIGPALDPLPPCGGGVTMHIHRMTECRGSRAT